MKFKTLLLASMMLASTAASAITYTVNFAASNLIAGSGPLAATYTISTDGTLGALASDNITGYTLSINYNGTITNSSGSSIYYNGGGVSATKSMVSVDFGRALAGLVLYNGADAVCFIASGISCVGEPTPASVIFLNSGLAYGYLPRSGGVEVIATAAAVPEAATWTLMVAGFGLVGAAIRRRSAAVAA